MIAVTYPCLEAVDVAIDVDGGGRRMDRGLVQARLVSPFLVWS